MDNSEKLTLTLPSFNCWKDLRELYDENISAEQLIANIQKDYPNGIKIINNITEKYKIE